MIGLIKKFCVAGNRLFQLNELRAATYQQNQDDSYELMIRLVSGDDITVSYPNKEEAEKEFKRICTLVKAK